MKTQNTQNTKQTENPKRKTLQQSMIAAVMHVSESEIYEAYPDYQADWETKAATVFTNMLWNFGLNTNQEYVRQDGLQHRNRLGKVVTCSRWYGSERHDSDWLKSGYASQACIDRAKNNKLLDDSYRIRHLTTDAQYALEQRDRNDVIKED
jgi:hypothetical protein